MPSAIPTRHRRAASKKLPRSFYAREAEALAHDLIGMILVHRVVDKQLGGRELRGRIVETEAYVGCHDLACHAAKGRTARTEVMFGEPGHAYVYLIYGIHDMLNIVSGDVGIAQAVLVRAAEPLDGWDANLSGPGNLAKGFGITRRIHNGIDLTGDELFLLDRATASPPRIVRTRRIGVDYAEQWKDAPLRFIDADSPKVSRPKFK
ncbi:MAG TPA: DNA-3-methyladenine glycosylase [Tepidisphaeraceae bacterium]|nr:DNA-3-methyladenine glycosylase [Tepidisphaeraceae bacterium]